MVANQLGISRSMEFDIRHSGRNKECDFCKNEKKILLRKIIIFLTRTLQGYPETSPKILFWQESAHEKYQPESLFPLEVREDEIWVYNGNLVTIIMS